VNRQSVRCNHGNEFVPVSQLLLSTQFVIWVIYGVLAGMGHWPVGVAFGLLASACLLALEASRHIKIKLLDWVLLGYFVLAAIRPSWSGRQVFLPTVRNHLVLYAGVSWGSILLGARSPCNMRANPRRRALAEPGFIRANQVISRVWSLAFVINIVLVTIALNPRTILC